MCPVVLPSALRQCGVPVAPSSVLFERGTRLKSVSTVLINVHKHNFDFFFSPLCAQMQTKAEPKETTMQPQNTAIHFCTILQLSAFWSIFGTLKFKSEEACFIEPHVSYGLRFILGVNTPENNHNQFYFWGCTRALSRQELDLVDFWHSAFPSDTKALIAWPHWLLEPDWSVLFNISEKSSSLITY